MARKDFGTTSAMTTCSTRNRTIAAMARKCTTRAIHSRRTGTQAPSTAPVSRWRGPTARSRRPSAECRHRAASARRCSCRRRHGAAAGESGAGSCATSAGRIGNSLRRKRPVASARSRKRGRSRPAPTWRRNASAGRRRAAAESPLRKPERKQGRGVVDLPTRADHHQHGQGVDPMHGPHPGRLDHFRRRWRRVCSSLTARLDMAVPWLIHR